MFMASTWGYHVSKKALSFDTSLILGQGTKQKAADNSTPKIKHFANS